MRKSAIIGGVLYKIIILLWGIVCLLLVISCGSSFFEALSPELQYFDGAPNRESYLWLATVTAGWFVVGFLFCLLQSKFKNLKWGIIIHFAFSLLWVLYWDDLWLYAIYENLSLGGKADKTEQTAVIADTVVTSAPNTVATAAIDTGAADFSADVKAILSAALECGGCGYVCRECEQTAVTADTAAVLTDSIRDSRDGKTYKKVTIGKQVWMAENLNYDAKGSVCYDNKPENCARFGRLYNWKTALKACPVGWHLPSDAEWDVLMVAVGGVKDGDYYWQGAGTKLKSSQYWNNYDNVPKGTDNYRFSALPGGYGNSDGYFLDAGYYGYWWSATEFNADYAWDRIMYYYEYVYRNYLSKDDLFSVRCVQDTGGQK